MFVFCEFVNCLIFQERQNWDFLQEKCFDKHRNFFFKTSRREKQRKKTFLNEIRFFEKKEKISNFVSTFEKLVFSLSVDFFRESGQFANRNRNRTGPVNCQLAVCLSFKIFFWPKVETNRGPFTSATFHRLPRCKKISPSRGQNVPCLLFF